MNYLKKTELKNFVFILINDFSLIAFSNAIEPLRLANRLAQKQLYSWKITSETGEKVKCSSGFYLDVESSIHKIQNDDYLILCSGENIKKNIFIFFSVIEICSVACFISTIGSDCFSIFVSS